MSNIPPSILIAIPAMWILALILVYALRRPWRKLAEVYGFDGELPTEFRSRGSSGRIGWLRYRGGITVAADARGLYLNTPFVPWSRKLFFPWEDIFMVEKKRFLETTMKLTFKRMPEYPVELNHSAVERLLPARKT
jgi:hypothetical protein